MPRRAAGGERQEGEKESQTRRKAPEKAPEKAPKKGSAVVAVKNEAATTSTALVCCIDLDDDDVEEVVPIRAASKIKPEKVISIKPERIKPEKIKSEIKPEMKKEDPREERRKKKAKIKQERNKDADGGNGSKQSGAKDTRKRSRSRSRKRRSRSRSSSSSSSSSSLSESEMYKRVKPYTKVQLANLVRKADLNGMTGMVLHPSVAVCPCPPGCILVRLETGREIAVKPANVQPLQSFHVGLNQAPLSQAARLTQVLKNIRNPTDDPAEGTEGGGSILEQSSGPQGGIGHML